MEIITVLVVRLEGPIIIGGSAVTIPLIVSASSYYIIIIIPLIVPMMIVSVSIRIKREVTCIFMVIYYTEI